MPTQLKFNSSRHRERSRQRRSSNKRLRSVRLSLIGLCSRRGSTVQDIIEDVYDLQLKESMLVPTSSDEEENGEYLGLIDISDSESEALDES
jgi:hypothetical protein